MASTLSLNRAILPRNRLSAAAPAFPARFSAPPHHPTPIPGKRKQWWGATTALTPGSRVAWRTSTPPAPSAGSRADDSSAPFEMSVENALKLLGVSEGASFDDILRAKNAIVASCKDDQEAIAQVEAAYDMLLMQSLTQRRAGKVASNNVRYADVKPVRSSGTSSLPQWLNNLPVSIDTPSTSSLGIEAGIYGALMIFTYASGTSISAGGVNSGADVPGLILATGFGASLYFLTKKNVNLGKAALMTVGGLVVGAVVGSAVENFLQVDIVPLFGIRSPAVVVSEFVLISQFLVSLYLR